MKLTKVDSQNLSEQHLKLEHKVIWINNERRSVYCPTDSVANPKVSGI